MKRRYMYMINKIRNWFLTGILVSLPIIITFYIAVEVLAFFDNLILPNLFPHSILNSIPGTGVVLSLAAMVLIGFIATNFLGQYLISWSNKILNKIPLLRSIYSVTKQVLDTVLSNNSAAFRDVILIEYPKKDMWVLAFVTSENKSEIQEQTKEDVINVFLPTCPNPTSGFLLFVPKKDVIYLDMPADAAMKLIISGGVIDVSDYKRDGIKQRKNGHKVKNDALNANAKQLSNSDINNNVPEENLLSTKAKEVTAKLKEAKEKTEKKVTKVANKKLKSTKNTTTKKKK